MFVSQYSLIHYPETDLDRAVGAAYLAKRKAIVQKLTAIESLAGTFESFNLVLVTN